MQINPRSILREFSEGIREWIYPRSCWVCAGALEDESSFFCGFCLEKAFVEPEIVTSWLPECISCVASLWKLDSGGPLHRLLHSLKYADNREAGENLGDLIGSRLMPRVFENYVGLPDEIVLCPVPLHSERKRTRGYNQSDVISERIASVTGCLKIPEGVLRRVKSTPSQTGLRADERWKNLEDAFEISDPAILVECVRQRTLVIVDDVFTTGATTFRLAATIRDSLPESENFKAIVIAAAQA